LLADRQLPPSSWVVSFLQHSLVHSYLQHDVTTVQVRARWPGHVTRRAFDDVMSGLRPTWPDDDAETVLDVDRWTVERAVDARNACELYTQQLTDVIGSKVRLRTTQLFSL